MRKLLSGKEISANLLKALEKDLKKLQSLGVTPTLAIVRVGENPDDIYYQNAANQKFISFGGKVENFNLPSEISTEAFEKAMNEINENEKINGILVLRPLPNPKMEERLKEIISPSKDLEGLSYENTGKLFCASPCFSPITPLAVMELIKQYNIDLEGKNVVVVGRSLVVGKPLAIMLLRENATVTVAHSKTKNLSSVCQNADILVTAIGKANFVDERFVKEGAIVIDVGTNVAADGSLTGDCNFGAIEKACSLITPVPGGVGAVTNAVLFSVLVKATINSLKIDTGAITND